MRYFRRPIVQAVPAALLLLAAGWLAQAGLAGQAASSRAYVGHESDADVRGFIARYPAAAGTRLDDCQTCHRGGIKGRRRSVSAGPRSASSRSTASSC